MLNRDKLDAILISLGKNLSKPCRITVVGSAASMIWGQDGRQTPDIDVWRPTSEFDEEDLRNACYATGILFNPTGNVEHGDVYIQILRPGIVEFPGPFERTLLGQYGNLAVDMPPAEMIVASKLVRCNSRDIEDVMWWMANANLSKADVEAAINLIPGKVERESALENLVLIDIQMPRTDDPERDDSLEP
ncbi:MAG: hypothetical protein F4213_13185 [Boseongicola sp. SB0677_bin_26]|nr:hypothetical protein [Boseongicola sp. SB0665_bin_10]MYG26954.1 hypothetical protein [Boseongicola sp. SB0677_bin_26]